VGGLAVLVTRHNGCALLLLSTLFGRHAKLRHLNISRMRAAGVAADVVAAWHGHTERMTQAVYGRVTDDRLTAASAVFEPRALGQS
jgi:hypothetical protein